MASQSSRSNLVSLKSGGSDEKTCLGSAAHNRSHAIGMRVSWGSVVGAGAAGGGYEYQAYRQMQQLEEDYKNRRISREEYEDRKKQI